MEQLESQPNLYLTRQTDGDGLVSFDQCLFVHRLQHQLEGRNFLQDTPTWSGVMNICSLLSKMIGLHMLSYATQWILYMISFYC